MKRIVIDIDCLSRVFNKNNSEHAEYKPLHDCIFQHRNLEIAYGGEKYCAELEIASHYLKIFSELKKVGQAILLDNDNINRHERTLIGLTKGTRFNDQHIIAIVIEGRCGIICSEDSNSYIFFQDRSLYPKRFRRPTIYSGLGSRSILN